MALIKSIPSPFGFDGTYWRIIGVETWYGGPNQVWPSKHAKPVTFVHLAQYVDEKAATDGAMSLQVRRIVLDGESNAQDPASPEYYKNPDALLEPTREAAYTALKQVRDFTDAVDG